MQDHLVKKMSDFETLLGYYASRVVGFPLTPPEHVYFSLTNRCNLRCKMCEVARSASSEEGELSTGKVKEIILQIRDMGINHIIFSGGEPLLRKDLTEIVRFAHENNIQMIDLITNGTMLDSSTLGKLVDAGLTHIGVSIDGLSRVSSGIRGPGVFEKVIKNLEDLNSYKKEHDTCLPSVGINFTIMGENIRDIPEMIGLARKLNCLFISFQPVLFNNTKMYMNKKNVLWPSSVEIKELKRVTKQLVKMKKESCGVNIFTDADVISALPDYFSGRRPRADFKCYEAIKRIVITCEGLLWSCQGILGDLKKNTLSQIWNSTETRNARRAIKKCKRHCLQDCVYFPSDIVKIARSITRPSFLTLSSWKDAPQERLLSRIDYYVRFLSESKAPDAGAVERLLYKRSVKRACAQLTRAKKYFLDKYTALQ
jgi:MoaA/NifB/PqqE/SkfB family radical SAM enzyme